MINQLESFRLSITTKTQVPLMSSSRMYTALKGYELFKSQLGLIRKDRMISAGMKRLAKRTGTTRYPSKRAITRTLLVSTMFTFTTFKMMVLGLVLVPRLQTWSSEMRRPRRKLLSRMSMQRTGLIQ